MGCNPAPPLGPMGLWLGDFLTRQSGTRSQLICTQHLLSFREVTTLAQMGRNWDVGPADSNSSCFAGLCEDAAHSQSPVLPLPALGPDHLLTPSSPSLPRGKRRSSDTAPRRGGSCTISSWDCCPCPGAAEPQRWSPIRCLHLPGRRRGLGGQDPPTS